MLVKFLLSVEIASCWQLFIQLISITIVDVQYCKLMVGRLCRFDMKFFVIVSECSWASAHSTSSSMISPINLEMWLITSPITSTTLTLTCGWVPSCASTSLANILNTRNYQKDSPSSLPWTPFCLCCMNALFISSSNIPTTTCCCRRWYWKYFMPSYSSSTPHKSSLVTL